MRLKPVRVSRQNVFNGTVLTLLIALVPAVTLAELPVLEEVIVTAQKREQNMMDVPVGMTAVTPSDLQFFGVRDTNDLVKISPSLTYDQTELAQNSGFRIRGVGTVVYSVSAESAVSVVIDDVSTSQSGQGLADLTGIERVEILRGPQSTLFGRNASAGVINVVTRGPAEEFESSVELTLTDDEQEKISLTASGPLMDSSAYRLTAYYDDIAGWVNNLSDGANTNGSRKWGVNTRFEWAPSDAFTLNLQAKYDDSDSSCCPPAFKSIDDVNQALVLTIVPLTTAAPELIPFIGDNNTTVNLDDINSVLSENLQYSAHAEWQFNEHSILSISSFNNWKLDEFNELDGTTYDLLNHPFGAGTLGDLTGSGIVPFTLASNGGVVQRNELDMDFFSQEFRIVSPDNSWGNYVAGMYWSQMDADRIFNRYAPGAGVAGGLDAHTLSTNKVSSVSAFGQLSWNLGARSRLTLGARYQYEDIDFDVVQIDFYGGGPDQNAGYTGDDKIFMGNVAYQYDLNEDAMVYARYASGHKGQFFDAAASEAIGGELEPVAPESSDAFELGYKAELFDNRMRLEIVGFYTLYKEYQAQEATITDAGALVFSTENVGELETLGIEIDSKTLIGQNFTLQAAMAWIDATIKEYDSAECYFQQTAAEGCITDANGIATQDLSGRDLQNSPDFKVSLAGTYVWPAGRLLPAETYLTAAYSWTDSAIHDLQLAPWMEADSYGILNLAAGMEWGSNTTYSLSLFVNNVLDRNYDGGLLDSSLAGVTVSTSRFVPRDHSRYVGLRLKADFR